MRIDFDLAVKRLLQNDEIVILTHANPDGDTIGSGFALMHALKSLGKKAAVLNSDGFAEKYSYITDAPCQKDFEEKFVVSVDVADSKLLGKELEEKYGASVDLSIDHHATNRLFAKETYLEPQSASACEIVFEIICAMNVQINREIANCLFTGVSTDTGCFRYSNVTPRTHTIASKLIECGANHAMINEKMFETKKLCVLELQQRCIEQKELLFGGKVCLFVITKKISEETGCEESDYDAIVALSRQIEGVVVGITLKEKSDGSFKASVRSGEGFDASAFCSAFGGGGHVRASGCSFDCSLEEAKDAIKRELEKTFC